MSPDLINALFEFGGALAISLSVVRAIRERLIAGVSFAHVTFFTAWGLWNLFYYPHLDQLWSFAAGVLLTIVNAVYLVLWIKFHKRKSQ